MCVNFFVYNVRVIFLLFTTYGNRDELENIIWNIVYNLLSVYYYYYCCCL